MHITRTLHSTGGTTALIAGIGTKQINAPRLTYVLIPATLGPPILLVVAPVINNLSPTRRYP